jgi:hypothetical protein
MLKRPFRSEEGKDMAHNSIQSKHRCGSRQLARRQQASWFHHGPFAMHPAFRSIGLSQGLFVGNWKGRMRTPLPVCLTRHDGVL